MYSFQFLFSISILLLFFTRESSCENSSLCQNKENNCEVFLNEVNIIQNINSTNTLLFSKSVQTNFNSLPDNFLENKANNILKGFKTQKKLNFQSKTASKQEQEIFTAIQSKILTIFSPFDASQNTNSTEACRSDTKLFLKGLENIELWALKMHDSTARLTSGILNGNINQYGDFDQCLAVRGPFQAFRGQYCLAYIQPKIISKSNYINDLLDLVQSHNAFKSDFNDPGHRVPRFSLINWGVCIPSSCTAKDAEHTLKNLVKNATKGTGIDFEIRVDPEMCQTDDFAAIDTATTLAICFFVMVLLISLLSTLYDYNTANSSQNQWMLAFSLIKNIRWLFNMEKLTDDISVIHGIRFLNAVMLLLAHKSLALFFVPYINRTHMTESLGQSWTVIGRAASLYTDPFLLFSGVLSSYSIIGRLQKNNPLKLKNEYMARFLRIVPPLVALIIFCTFILPNMGSGPQWNLVVGYHAVLCKKYWWRNLFFIHNYFGFSDMCLTHTHHLGIDTELFVIAPILLLILWKWPRNGLYVLLALSVLTTVARFHTTLFNELSNYIYFGTTIQKLFKTADYMYSFPPYRSTVYILGLLLGYALRLCKGKVLTKNQLRVGWTFSTILFVITIIGPAPMGHITYKYNPFHAACYAAFAPLGWCTGFSWIVFVSYLGHTNLLTDILSWRGFLITTKLSYALYLTQFPVFFYNVGRRRHSDYFNFIPLIVNFNEIMCIIIASILLTLLFDAPFQNIKKIILKKSLEKKKEISHANNKIL